mgnify:CR=1 FL=1
MEPSQCGVEYVIAHALLLVFISALIFCLGVIWGSMGLRLRG